MPKSREWKQVFCLESIGITWAPCLVFEVQENTESQLLKNSLQICLKLSFGWNFHIHTDGVWFSILFFNNVFLPVSINFELFYSRAVRLPTSWKNRKTFPGRQSSPARPPPSGLNRSHSNDARQRPRCQPESLPSTMQAYTQDKIVCPNTFILWPRILKHLFKNWKMKSPSIDSILLVCIVTTKMVWPHICLHSDFRVRESRVEFLVHTPLPRA